MSWHDRRDRAIGVILGSAAGDALGAPYEFQPPLKDQGAVEFKPGGGWDLGEWTDDTAMMVPILEAVTRGYDLLHPAAHGRIVARWLQWAARDPKDIGNQTRAVLGSLRNFDDDSEDEDAHLAAECLAASKTYAAEHAHAGGNGSLMRTGPIALAYLRDEDARRTAQAAAAISDLTHYDPDARDACVLWTVCIRHALLTGELNMSAALDALPEERRGLWHDRLKRSETERPWEFALNNNNGWVVASTQAAYAAVHQTSGGLKETLEGAVRAGWDTDTIACIAGQLAGALFGASDIEDIQKELHGWPGYRALHLEALTRAAIDRQERQ